MRVIRVRNVREALPAGLLYLSQEGQVEDSRAGQVVVAPGPVTTAYERPAERVLLSPVRDANPFFHLAEAVWMLSGRQDAAFLNEYVRDFGERFAEPDGTIHDAYGWRWSSAFGFDQLNRVVEVLRKDPQSRQCVIGMWDPREHMEVLDEGENDLCGAWRTRPCNTHAYLRVCKKLGMRRSISSVLDITVCCRSNDMIMGGYGANAVHFSVLQEYLAARIGAGVGRYYQVSNNFHVYLSDVRRMVGRIDERVARLDPHTQLEFLSRHVTTPGEYEGTAPLFDAATPNQADEDIQHLNRAIDHLHGCTTENGKMPIEPALRHGGLRATVFKALAAHHAHRLGLHDRAVEWAGQVESPDWRRACVQWLQRRSR